MKKTIISILVILALVLTLSLSTVFGAQQQYVIKYGYVAPELTYYDNFETAFITAFKGYVERESGGRIKVESYPAGQLGNFQALVEGCMMGTVQMASVETTGAFSGVYRESMALSIPGIFESIEESNAVLAGPWGQAFNEAIRKKLGIKVLSHISKGFRHFTNNVRELRVPEDAKGLNFRVMESPVPIKMVEALGCVASPIPSAEMYSALQQGVVDGQENPIASIIQDRTYEVQKYLILDGHTNSYTMFIMSERFFNSLPKDLQKIVLEGARRGEIASQGIIYLKEEVGIEFLKTKLKVYTPTPEEKAKWHAKISGPTAQYVRSQIGDKPVDDLIKAVEEFRKSKK